MLHQRLLDSLDSSSPPLFIEAVYGSGKRTVLRQWEGGAGTARRASASTRGAACTEQPLPQLPGLALIKDGALAEGAAGERGDDVTFTFTFTSTATATGTPPAGEPPVDEDEVTVPLPPAPGPDLTPDPEDRPESTDSAASTGSTGSPGPSDSAGSSDSADSADSSDQARRGPLARTGTEVAGLATLAALLIAAGAAAVGITRRHRSDQA